MRMEIELQRRVMRTLGACSAGFAVVLVLRDEISAVAVGCAAAGQRLVDDPRLWGPCRDLIGCEELSLFSDKLNVKRPGGAPFPWHQEGHYWVYGAEQLEKIVRAGVLVYSLTWTVPGDG